MRRMTIMFAVLMFVAGCSTMSVRTYSDPGAQFAKSKTYAWAPAPQKKSGNPILDEKPEFDEAVRADIDAALAKRGYALDHTGHPDFWVSYYATLNKRVSVQTLNDFNDYHQDYAFNYALGYSPTESQEAIGRRYVDSFDEGTLIIDVSNPTTRQLMWRATAQDQANLKSSSSQKRAKLKAAIDAMLAKFPPGKAA